MDDRMSLHEAGAVHSSLNGKSCFFLHAVVIEVSCSRSREHGSEIATHSWLGGQHGEEAKSEGSGEKGRKEAPEEEVGSRHFKRSLTSY
jgi:hypothetical protein